MSNNYSDNSFTRFLTGKGFYVVLALCLVGAGTAAWAAVGRDATVQPDPPPPVGQTAQPLARQDPPAQQWGFLPIEDAGGSQAGVAVESSKPSSPSPKAPSSSKPSETPAAALPQSAAPVSSPKQSFVLPIDGEVFADYSGVDLVKSETLNDWRTHNGIDVKAAEGTAVQCVAAGTVSAVRNDVLWGFVVEVTHSGALTSVYCGLDKEIPVRQGDAVRTGQTIGTVGYIPVESTLPTHLHFEMKDASGWLDPLVTLNKK